MGELKRGVMNYITIGNKKNPAVVFLHGWGGSIDSWGLIPARIAGFGFYSIVIDFSGFGDSAEPTNAYFVKDYAEELRELLSQLEITSCVLIGHSFGGRVAIKYSSLYGENVSKLVLVDSAGLKPRRGLTYKLKVWRYKSLKRKVERGLKPKQLLNKYGSDDYRSLSPVMKQTFINVVNEDLSHECEKIECDSLIVWGRNDKDTPLNMAKKLKKLIKNSRLEIYDAGHFSYLECMERFIDEIYIFMLLE